MASQKLVRAVRASVIRVVGRCFGKGRSGTSWMRDICVTLLLNVDSIGAGGCWEDNLTDVCRSFVWCLTISGGESEVGGGGGVVGIHGA